MPYIIKFRWVDCTDFKKLLREYQEHPESGDLKELYWGGRGAMQHPRFNDAKPVMDAGHGCAVVEWKGRVYAKEDIPKAIENVKSHLRSFGIKSVDVGEPQRVNTKEYEMYDRKRSKAKPKTKRCRCK